MATIFLSYRRTDGPEACRVYDWLGQRFGYDCIFMDVAAIPFAVRFPEFIRQAIAKSRVLIALIGAQWAARIRDENDPVRMEIEAAIANQIPMLPLLIGNTPMPNVDELPASISAIASQNATTVGVLLDFHSHMQILLPKIESILGALASTSVGQSDPYLIDRACRGIINYLREKAFDSAIAFLSPAEWRVIGVDYFSEHFSGQHTGVTFTLYLHRVQRLADLIELHFLLSFWSKEPSYEQVLAGWVMSQFEQSPIVPDEFLKLESAAMTNKCILKVRWSDEDPRQVWKSITEQPLRLSFAYVATVSPKATGAEVPSVLTGEDAGIHPLSIAAQPPLAGDAP